MDQRGFTLVEVLIGGALLTFGVVMAVQVFSSRITGVMKAEQLGENEDLRSWVRGAFDCSATVRRERATCTAGGFIQGYDKNNNPIISNASAGHFFGANRDINLKLKCVDNGVDYTVNAYATRGSVQKELFEVPISCLKCSGVGTTDPYTFTGGPHNLKNAVVAAALECGDVIPNFEFRRSYGATGGGNRWTADGTYDLPTLQKVCDYLGYTTYVSSTCHDWERSGRYPSGKCNWHSPGNNELQWFDGTSWSVTRGPPKYQWTWISQITCSGRK